MSPVSQNGFAVGWRFTAMCPVMTAATAGSSPIQIRLPRMPTIPRIIDAIDSPLVAGGA